MYNIQQGGNFTGSRNIFTTNEQVPGNASANIVGKLNRVRRVLMKTFPALRISLVCVLAFIPLFPLGQFTAKLNIPAPAVDHEFEHIIVNTSADSVDLLADDFCADQSGNCSLRAAVQCANLWPGEQTIELADETYTLTRAGANENAAATGDLDVSGALIITGTGLSFTVIDGGSIDRVLEVLPEAVVQIYSLTLTNGRAASTTSEPRGRDGGGILNHASLSMENVRVSGNSAGAATSTMEYAGDGGGIFNDLGALVLNLVEIKGNETANGIDGYFYGGDGGHGAGIYSRGGTVVLTDSQVVGNSTGNGGNGSSTVNSNGGDGGSGGGITLSTGAVITATRTLIELNITGAGGYGNHSTTGYGGAGGAGAGINVGDGSMTLDDSLVQQNTTGAGGTGCGDISSPMGCMAGVGAGIAVFGNEQNARLDLIGTIVQSNGVGLPGSLAVNGGHGGGIYCEDAILNLTDSSLEANLAGNAGAGTLYSGSGGRAGGLYALDCTTDITGGAIRNNHAGNGALATYSGLGGNGGGLFAAGSGALTITDAAIADNHAGDGGGTGRGGSGGGLALGMVATLSGVTISGNSVGTDSSGTGGWGNGGGIYTGYPLTMLNSTLSGNIGGYGGGIYTQTTLYLQSDTITLNSSPDPSGGWGGVAGLGSTYTRNTIIANNTANSFPNCYSLISQGYNLVGDLTCTITGDLTSNLTGVDAQLGPLQDNGGPTFTHMLGAISPAIDGANPAEPGSGGNACPALDQRGLPRNIFACDIGAVEAQIGDIPEPIVRLLTSGVPASFGPSLALATLTEGDSFYLGILRSTTPPNGVTDPEINLPVFWELTQEEITQTLQLQAPLLPASFSMDITLCYTDAELGSIPEENLFLMRWDGANWIGESSVVDSTNNCLTTTGISTLGVWSVGIANRFYLPLIVR
jgi:hypothetical protein